LIPFPFSFPSSASLASHLHFRSPFQGCFMIFLLFVLLFFPFSFDFYLIPVSHVIQLCDLPFFRWKLTPWRLIIFICCLFTRYSPERTFVRFSSFFPLFLASDFVLTPSRFSFLIFIASHFCYFCHPITMPVKILLFYIISQTGGISFTVGASPFARFPTHRESFSSLSSLEMRWWCQVFFVIPPRFCFLSLSLFHTSWFVVL
jgi:hypothetical protein